MQMFIKTEYYELWNIITKGPHVPTTIDITNNLKSLGKMYINEEMVRKILRCLPKNKWGPKVTTIEEAQDLKTLALDDLLGKFLTHEIHLKEDKEEVQPNGE